MIDTSIYVFVYGSLKTDFHNHGYMDTSMFIQRDVTMDNDYLMISLGSYPAVVHGGINRVSGEIYKINSKTLEALDILEGYPKFYTRSKIKLKAFEPLVWMYMLSVNIDSLNPQKLDYSNIINIGDVRQWTKPNMRTKEE